ncbi:sugar ABC transporter substrate-binding protein [Paenibacillus sp. J5C_2022]|uniref:ABC transporter substrate-binding protein n=1 Tax=Paenibacillus sp. J5C2022 TaxID=2977129 RepID=UPI0021D09CBC|nr:sugar ABC transporter substrate-binding protein [Paenibacillus sp. J5C2022]MCU6712880.1 sugar ABC transporter substrate-binding protein [Paenibacillus sp. J5C2022]
MKKVSMMIVMLALMIVVSACGGATENKAGNGDGKTDGGTAKKVTITYGGWGLNTMEPVVKAFNDSHPNIEVKLENTPYKQYWTKLETAATGDTLPDVFWMNGPHIVKYAANGMLADLGENIKADNLDLDNYPKALVDLYSYDGKNYGIPKDYDTIGLYFNKKLFDEKGVSYPDDSWDWSTLVEAAKKLTDSSNGVYGFAAMQYGQEYYYNTILQAGGFVISEDKKTSGYDKPEAIEGVKFLTDMIHVHKVSPTLAQLTETSAADLFKSGKLAMYYDGSWAAVDMVQVDAIKDSVDVAVLPKGKEQGVVLHGLGHVMSAKSKHPKEAWEFIKFLGSKEAAEIAGKAGGAIPAFKGGETNWLSAYPNMNVQIFIDQLAYASPYPVSKDTSVWTTYEEEQLTKAWIGEGSVEDLMKELGRKMNEALAAEQ